MQRDFDPTRDFSAYRAWSWKEPALQYRPDDPRIQSDLTEQRIRDAIAEQLDQRGLRPPRRVPRPACRCRPGTSSTSAIRPLPAPGATPGMATGADRCSPIPAPSTIRSAPCRSICMTPPTASWSGVAVPSRYCAAARARRRARWQHARAGGAGAVAVPTALSQRLNLPRCWRATAALAILSRR